MSTTTAGAPRTVLQICPLLPSLDQALATKHHAVRLTDQTDPEAFLAERGGEVVAAVTTARIGVSDALMDALPRLGAIVHFGVGYETTDVVRARARGIDVSNTPDVLTDCVADLAVGAVISVLRRLAEADRYVRAGAWESGAFPLATRVSGKQIGILGLGRIGRAIARRLAAFDAELGYHSRRHVADVPYHYAESARDLAAWADVLVVATAGGAATNGLVSAEVLAALGPDGYLVNIARGSVVDEPALVEALLGRGIAGAALDVFAEEPRVPAPLLDLDNVLLLPHIASATRETREAMGDLAYRNLDHYLTTGRLLTPVPL